MYIILCVIGEANIILIQVLSTHSNSKYFHGMIYFNILIEIWIKSIVKSV